MPFRKAQSWGNIKPPAGSQLDWGDPINARKKVHLLFGEGAGTISTNLCFPSKFIGTDAGSGIPKWQNGKFGRSLYFGSTGSSTYLDQNFVLPAGQDITISIWIRCDVSDQTGAIFTFGNLNSAGDRVETQPYNDANLYWDYGDFGTDRISTSYTAIVGKWTHLVLIGGKNFRSILFNNIVQNSNNTGATGPNAQTGLWVGAWPVATGGNSYLRGAIDNFSVWFRQLKYSEVERLYTEPFAGILAPKRRIMSSSSVGIRGIARQLMFG